MRLAARSPVGAAQAASWKGGQVLLEASNAALHAALPLETAPHLHSSRLRLCKSVWRRLKWPRCSVVWCGEWSATDCSAQPLLGVPLLHPTNTTRAASCCLRATAYPTLTHSLTSAVCTPTWSRAASPASRSANAVALLTAFTALSLCCCRHRLLCFLALRTACCFLQPPTRPRCLFQPPFNRAMQQDSFPFGRVLRVSGPRQPPLQQQPRSQCTVRNSCARLHAQLVPVCVCVCVCCVCARGL